MRKIIFLFFLIFSCTVIKSSDQEIKYYLDNKAYIIVKNNKMYGNLGVNNFNANISKLKNEEIKINSIFSTKMASTKDEMLKEKGFIDLLYDIKRIEKNENFLVMTKKDNTKVYLLNKESILNKEYKLKNTRYKDLNISLKFGNDILYGYSGVNNYNSKYEIKNSRLYIYETAITLRMAEDEKMNLETEFLDLLKDNDKIEIKNNQLILLTKKGQKLIFDLAN